METSKFPPAQHSTNVHESPPSAISSRNLELPISSQPKSTSPAPTSPKPPVRPKPDFLIAQNRKIPSGSKQKGSNQNKPSISFDTSMRNSNTPVNAPSVVGWNPKVLAAQRNESSQWPQVASRPETLNIGNTTPVGPHRSPVGFEAVFPDSDKTPSSPLQPLPTVLGPPKNTDGLFELKRHSVDGKNQADVRHHFSIGWGEPSPLPSGNSGSAMEMGYSGHKWPVDMEGPKNFMRTVYVYIGIDLTVLHSIYMPAHFNFFQS